MTAGLSGRYGPMRRSRQRQRMRLCICQPGHCDDACEVCSTDAPLTSCPYNDPYLTEEDKRLRRLGP